MKVGRQKKNKTKKGGPLPPSEHKSILFNQSCVPEVYNKFVRKSYYRKINNVRNMIELICNLDINSNSNEKREEKKVEVIHKKTTSEVT